MWQCRFSPYFCSMAQDIFISYSSKDRELAVQLSEKLKSEGLTVWIDGKDILGAEQWTAEIVEGIKSCSTFLLLISPDSVVSGNVLKELTLASEKNKRILPVELRMAEPPPALEYLIAGLQRVPVTDFPAIVRSHRLGVERIKAKDERKSLIILPFEDLSPGQDNLWFANGLAGELIDSLSHIKSLRILDRKTSLDLRGVKQTTVEIGKLFNTRYFVEGSVRKFEKQIKISISLLDVEMGDYLWQESYKGEMKDIFDLQESVAGKVIEGLKLHLTNKEKSLLEERGTENAEAYELYVKANEYYLLQTKEGFELAIQLYSEAIRIDPMYVQPYAGKANALAMLYRGYERKETLLNEAEQLCNEASKIQPDYLGVYYALIQILMHRKKIKEAELLAKEWVEKDSTNSHSHFELGFLYVSIDQPQNAIASYEEAIRLEPEMLTALGNVMMACLAANENEKCLYWAKRALTSVDRHIRLHPDDEANLVLRPFILHCMGKDLEALSVIQELIDVNSSRHIRDGRSLYNIAYLLILLDKKLEALRVFKRTIQAGYRNIRYIKEFLLNEEEGVAAYINTPEYNEVKQLIEAIEEV
jgi:adenylate cyclase